MRFKFSNKAFDSVNPPGTEEGKLPYGESDDGEDGGKQADQVKPVCAYFVDESDDTAQGNEDEDDSDGEARSRRQRTGTFGHVRDTDGDGGSEDDYNNNGGGQHEDRCHHKAIEDSSDNDGICGHHPSAFPNLVSLTLKSAAK
ncbi:hypothetical protein BJY00DRAFT_308215 [Aspergillus carlsbadensis]|nr:hypothetical protein BJY00DRAFT_308215 [Aspergillus carlsbadensis]